MTFFTHPPPPPIVFSCVPMIIYFVYQTSKCSDCNISNKSRGLIFCRQKKKWSSEHKKITKGEQKSCPQAPVIVVSFNCFNFELDLLQNALCKYWLKLVQWFWGRGFLNPDVFSINSKSMFTLHRIWLDCAIPVARLLTAGERKNILFLFQKFVSR